MKKLSLIFLFLSTTIFAQKPLVIKNKALDQDAKICVNDGGVEKCPVAIVGSTGNVSTTGTWTFTTPLTYSAISLANSILNSDISSSTTIDGSKLQAASASNAGVVTTGAQTIAGNKTFTGVTTIGTLKSNQIAYNAQSLTDNTAQPMFVINTSSWSTSSVEVTFHVSYINAGTIGTAYRKAVVMIKTAGTTPSAIVSGISSDISVGASANIVSTSITTQTIGSQLYIYLTVDVSSGAGDQFSGYGEARIIGPSTYTF